MGVRIVPKNLNERQTDRVIRIGNTDKARAERVGNRISERRANRGIGQSTKPTAEKVSADIDKVAGMKRGGMVKKAKNGFPDLNKDGKITKADILKGRGVIAKSGMKMKKQAATAIAMKKAGVAPKKMMKRGGMMKKGC